MGVFGSLFGRKASAPLPVRETLFGDLSSDRWPEGAADSFPWSAFVAARGGLKRGRTAAAIGYWREVLARPGLESRHYLQAWHLLRQHGQHPSPEAAKQVLGIVVEMAMPQGLDILAAYADRSARYYNYSGAGVVWERPDDSLDALVDLLLAVGALVAARIGPWIGPARRPRRPGRSGCHSSPPAGCTSGRARWTSSRPTRWRGRCCRRPRRCCRR